MPHGKLRSSPGVPATAAASRGRGAGGASSSSSAAVAASSSPSAGGLPDHVRAALQRTSATVDRMFARSAASARGPRGRDDPAWQLLTANGSAALVRDVASLERYFDMAATIERQSAAGMDPGAVMYDTAAAALSLDRGAAALAVLQLVAAAVRVPWQISPTPHHPQAQPVGGGEGGSNAAVPPGQLLLLQQHEVVDSARRLASSWLRSGVHAPSVSEAPPVHHLQFARRLVRMQTLQAAAQQLAAAADCLEALAPPSDTGAEEEQVEGQGEEGTAAGGRGDARRLAGDLLCDNMGLLHGLIYFLFCQPPQPQLPPPPQPQPPQQQQRQECLQELAEALWDSRVMEHAARVLIGLERTATIREGLGATTRRAAELYLEMYSGMHVAAVSRPGSHLFDLLQEVKAGSCANLAALVHGLAGLVVADDGPVYGMDEHLSMWRFPVILCPPPLRRQSSAPQRLAPAVVACMTSATWSARRAGSLSRRATRALRLRLVRLAVETGKYDAAAELASRDDDAMNGSSSGSGAAASGSTTDYASRVASMPSDAVLLHPSDTAFVALWGLDDIAAAAQDIPDAAAAAAAPHVVAEVVDWWRLALEAARHAMGAADAWKLLRMGGLLATPPLLRADSAEVIGPLTAAALPPPLWVEVALAGGLLPGLESLFRRAGRGEAGTGCVAPECTIVQGIADCLLPRFNSTNDAGAAEGEAVAALGVWRYLGPLLAHGEPLQAAALVATFRQLLRGVVVRCRQQQQQWRQHQQAEQRMQQAQEDLQQIQQELQQMQQQARQKLLQRRQHQQLQQMQQLQLQLQVHVQEHLHLQEQQEQHRIQFIDPYLLGLPGAFLLEAVETQQSQSNGDHEQQPMPPPPAAVPATPAAAQSSLMLSYAAREWLPSFAALMREQAPLMWRGDRVPGFTYRLLLLWLRVLLHAGSRQGGAADAAAAQSGSGSSANTGSSSASTSGAGVGSTRGLEADNRSSEDDATAHSWRRFVTQDIGAVELLGAVLCGGSNDTLSSSSTVTLVDTATACCDLVVECPEEVLSLRCSTGTGAGGAAAAAEAVVPAAAATSGRGQCCWSQTALCLLISELLARGEKCSADAVHDLVRLLRDAEAGSLGQGDVSGGGGGSGGRSSSSSWNRILSQYPALQRLRSRARDADAADAVLVRQQQQLERNWLESLSRVLVPPEEVSRRLRVLLPTQRWVHGGCDNPACTLEGDSEADVVLRACARCSTVSYCCKECQTAHWRAGHKAECSTLVGGRT